MKDNRLRCFFFFVFLNLETCFVKNNNINSTLSYDAIATLVPFLSICLGPRAAPPVAKQNNYNLINGQYFQESSLHSPAASWLRVNVGLPVSLLSFLKRIFKKKKKKFSLKIRPSRRFTFHQNGTQTRRHGRRNNRSVSARATV